MNAPGAHGTGKPPLRVVVAEDESLIRLDLVEMLREEGYDVVGEAADGQQAVEVGTLQPVQLVKGAVRASAGVHVHHAQLSTCMGGVAGYSGVLR